MKRCEHTEGKRHDCAYVDARNALIEEAEAAVIEAIGPAPERSSTRTVQEYYRVRDQWEARWNAEFHAAMNRLVAKKEKL